MKAYTQFLKELPSKKVVFAFGRFQPPTTGHELLVRAVERLASTHNASHVIYASRTQDKTKNPLPVDRKVYFLKRMFPTANFMAAGPTTRTFIEVAKELNKKYKDVIMVAGSDRVAEYTKLLNQYNGKEFNFNTIQVVSAGERDPDSDDASGMSGTKMRDAAKKGDFNTFKKGLPTTLTTADGRRLMNELRQAMGLELVKEQVTVTDWLRESYYRGEVFKVGEIVESNGVKYEILDRGSNYLTVVDSAGNTHRKWLHDVTIVEDYTEADQPTSFTYKNYTPKNLQHPQVLDAFQHIAKQEDLDPVAILNALKATDEYYGILNKAVANDEVSEVEVAEFDAALQRAQEYLAKLGVLHHHVDYINTAIHDLDQVRAQYHAEKDEQLEESMKTFRDLMEMKFSSSDKIKVARIIADALGVTDVEKSSSADQLLNNALRKIRNKPMRPEYMAVVKNMLQTAREAGINYDEKLVPGKIEEGYDDVDTSDTKLDKRGRKIPAHKLRFKNSDKTEMDEQAPTAPSIGVHRIAVTTSEPDHPMVSKRKETTQRFVRVTSNDKERAIEQGKKHFKKKGFKVHGAEHVGMVHEEIDQIDEISQKLAGNYYGAATKKHIAKVGVKPNMYGRIEKDMGKQRKAGIDRAMDRITGARKTNEETELDEATPYYNKASFLKKMSRLAKQERQAREKKEAEQKKEIKESYEEAQEHLSRANDAEREGRMRDYHAHMANHHDAMSQWHDEHGRSASADRHADKAEHHHQLSLSVKEETQICETADAGLAAKAKKSGISIGTLRKVYRRGVAAWNSGHRPGTTPQQWGMARVNSYITKGKGTYHGADKDLREEELLEGDTSDLPRVKKDKESGLPQKYVAGLSDATAKARAAHWKEKDKLSDSDPRAYEPAPGDATAKTKPSKHTKKYHAMFGEDMEEEILEACWDGYKQVGLKKKGKKMVPNCVPEAVNPAQQAAIAIAMKKAGKKPKNEEVELDEDCGCEDDKFVVGDTGKLSYDALKRFMGIQNVSDLGDLKKKSSFTTAQKRYMHEEEEKEEDNDEIGEDDFEDEITNMSEPDHIIDAYDDEELAIVDDETGEELDTDGYEDEDKEEEAKLKEGKIVILEISRMERIRRKQRFARTKSKREVRAQIALRKTSNQATISKRARRLATSMIKRRLLRKDPNKATLPEKERVEKFLQTRKALVDRLARRVAPRIRQIEKSRLQHKRFTK